MAQLTITLDDDLLQAAQAYAREHGQTLEELLIKILKNLTQSVSSVE